jgi:hypothetical protein
MLYLYNSVCFLNFSRFLIHKGCFLQTLLLFTKLCCVVDYSESCSLSAGRAVSLLGVHACGVSPVPLLPQESRNPLQSTLNSFRFKSNNLLEKSFILNNKCKTFHFLFPKKDILLRCLFLKIIHTNLTFYYRKDSSD